jgi:hypothetical protein
MKFLIEAMAIIFYSIVLSRFWYVQGFKEADFDRQEANKKIKDCLMIVGRIK